MRLLLGISGKSVIHNLCRLLCIQLPFRVFVSEQKRSQFYGPAFIMKQYLEKNGGRRTITFLSRKSRYDRCGYLYSSLPDLFIELGLENICICFYLLQEEICWINESLSSGRCDCSTLCLVLSHCCERVIKQNGAFLNPSLSEANKFITNELVVRNF